MLKIALVLCGGMGTRFAEVSKDPKILAEFRGKPFIDWLIDYIIDHSFDKIVFSLGYRNETVVKYLRNAKKDILIDYMIESVPLGTGGAVQAFFEKFNQNELYIFNGDTFFSQKLPERLFAKRLSTKVLVVCKSFDLNERFGDFSVKNGKLQIKRGTKDHPILDSNVYCGVARVPSSITFQKMPNKFSTEELFLNQNSEFEIVTYEGDVVDFGLPGAYQQLRKIYEV